MNDDRTPYHPISCEFHDLLEDLSTLRKRTAIGFRDEGGADQQRDAVITDVFAREGSEYVALDTGETVRLDRLVEVNGQRLADYDDGSACQL